MLKRIARAVFAAIIVLPAAGRAQPIETAIEFAIVVDYATGTVLYEKNADTPIPPASLAKLMTMYLLFEALAEGRYALDDTFVVSENAWRRGGAESGGSTMFAEVGSEIAIRDLMRGVIVQSGNDAAIAVAEGMADSEEAFATLMNDAAARLGLNGSVFANATGLPHPDQHVTARDLATLAATIISEFPEFYPIYSERDFTWNGITQSNRNPLLDDGIGVDGMKTGYTDASGYSLVASAVRDGRRLIAVVSGASSDNERAREAAALLERGFSDFVMVSPLADREVIGEAIVYGGAKPTVDLRLGAPLNFLVPRDEDADISGEIVYVGPIAAPVEEGDEIGTLRILLGGRELASAPIYAAETVVVGPLPRRAFDAVRDLLFGWQ